MNTKKLHLILNIGCIISLIMIILRIIFADTPELFKGGAIILDDILYDVSIAFIGSSFFYYLLVYIPANRDRKRIAIYTKYLSGLISFRGTNLIDALRQNVKINEKDEYTSQDFDLICSTINPNNQAPIIINTVNMTNGTWWDYFSNTYFELNKYLEKIMPYMYFMDSEHIELINNILKSGFYSTFSSMPNAKYNNKDITFLRKDLQELYSLSKKLKKYIDNN